MVLLLKVLLSQHGLDVPFDGGLGSYKLYVLVKHHLDLYRQLLLAEQPGNSGTTAAAGAAAAATATAAGEPELQLGGALLSFFYRYGDMPANSKKTKAQLEANDRNVLVRTVLSRKVPLQYSETGTDSVSGIGAVQLDFTGVFQLHKITRLFFQCYNTLRGFSSKNSTRWKNDVDTKWPILSCIVDEPRLLRDRERILLLTPKPYHYVYSVDENGDGDNSDNVDAGDKSKKRRRKEPPPPSTAAIRTSLPTYGIPDHLLDALDDELAVFQNFAQLSEEEQLARWKFVNIVSDALAVKDGDISGGDNFGDGSDGGTTSAAVVRGPEVVPSTRAASFSPNTLRIAGSFAALPSCSFSCVLVLEVSYRALERLVAHVREQEQELQRAKEESSPAAGDKTKSKAKSASIAADANARKQERLNRWRRALSSVDESDNDDNAIDGAGGKREVTGNSCELGNNDSANIKSENCSTSDDDTADKLSPLRTGKKYQHPQQQYQKLQQKIPHRRRRRLWDLRADDADALPGDDDNATGAAERGGHFFHTEDEEKVLLGGTATLGATAGGNSAVDGAYLEGQFDDADEVDVDDDVVPVDPILMRRATATTTTVPGSVVTAAASGAVIATTAGVASPKNGTESSDVSVSESGECVVDQPDPSHSFDESEIEVSFVGNDGLKARCISDRARNVDTNVMEDGLRILKRRLEGRFKPPTNVKVTIVRPTNSQRYTFLSIGSPAPASCSGIGFEAEIQVVVDFYHNKGDDNGNNDDDGLFSSDDAFTALEASRTYERYVFGRGDCANSFSSLMRVELLWELRTENYTCGGDVLFPAVVGNAFTIFPPTPEAAFGTLGGKKGRDAHRIVELLLFCCVFLFFLSPHNCILATLRCKALSQWRCF